MPAASGTLQHDARLLAPLCPYLDRGVCELGDPRCEGKRSYANCPCYRQERARLRAIIATCPHATRRADRGNIRGAPMLDHYVFCHAPGAPPRRCYPWPDDCPDYWRSLYQAVAGDARIRFANCARCGRLFVQRRADARCCSEGCMKTLWARKKRTQRGR